MTAKYSFLITVAILAASCSLPAGRAGAADPLQAKVQVDFSDVRFADAIRRLCEAAGVSVNVSDPPELGKYDAKSTGVECVNGEFSISSRVEDGRYLYSVRTTKPVALGELAGRLAEKERLVVTASGAALNVGPPPAPVIPSSFDPAVFRSRVIGFGLERPIQPDGDWKAAVAKATEAMEDYRAYSRTGAANFIYSDDCAAMHDIAVSAVKSYRQKDAVRVWLLCVTAYSAGLERQNIPFDSCGKDLQAARLQAVAAAIEAEQIVSSGASSNNIAELAGIVLAARSRKLNRKWIDNGANRQALILDVQNEACAAAGKVCLETGDYERAVHFYKKAAYGDLNLMFTGDRFRDYHSALSKLNASADGLVRSNNLERAAREDLAAATSLYVNMPADWSCWACGGDKLSHKWDHKTTLSDFHVRLANVLKHRDLDEYCVMMDAAIKLAPYAGPLNLPTGPRFYGINLSVHYARSLFAAGRREKALAVLKEARRNEPKDADILNELSLLLEQDGRKAEAIAAVEAYIEMMGDSPSMTDRLTVLKGLAVDARLDEQRQPVKKTRYDAIVSLYESRRTRSSTLTDARMLAEADERNRKIAELLKRSPLDVEELKRLQATQSTLDFQRGRESDKLALLEIVREQGLKEFPDDRLFMKIETELLLEMRGKDSEYEQRMKALAKAHPEIAATTLDQLADWQTKRKMAPVSALTAANRHGEALEALRAMFTKDQPAKEKLTFRAEEIVILRSMGRFGDALDVIRESLESDAARLYSGDRRRYPAKLFSIMKFEPDLLCRLGRKADAMQAFEKCVVFLNDEGRTKMLEPPGSKGRWYDHMLIRIERLKEGVPEAMPDYPAKTVRSAPGKMGRTPESGVGESVLDTGHADRIEILE